MTSPTPSPTPAAVEQQHHLGSVVVPPGGRYPDGGHHAICTCGWLGDTVWATTSDAYADGRSHVRASIAADIDRLLGGQTEAV